MTLFDIALKDLQQVLRDRKSLIFIVAMPLLFTVFFGVVLANPEGDPRLPIGIVNRDAGGTFADDLLTAINASTAVRGEELSEAQAGRIDELVSKETFAAVVIIPGGYSDQIVAGEEIPLEIVAQSDSPVGHTAVTTLKAIVKRQLSAAQSARFSTEIAVDRGLTKTEAEQQTYFAEALAEAQEAWIQPALTIEMQAGTRAARGEGEAPSGFAQSSPGMIVQFAVFGLITSASILMLERKTRTLQRMQTTPANPAAIIGGHALAMAALTFFQQAILIGVGQLALKLDYLSEPLGALIMMIALSLWAASLGMFIGAISEAEEKVIMWSLIAMFLFSALGGAWFPLEVTGQTFSVIGHLMPTAWAMDGFQNIIVRGLDFTSTLLPASMLLAYTLVFSALAIWRLRKAG